MKNKAILPGDQLWCIL